MISSVELTPSVVAPLAAELELTADEPVRIELDLDDGERRWTLSPGGEPARSRSLSVLGLRAAKDHRITIRAIDASGNTALVERGLTTKALPEEFPRLELVASDPARMEPGFTLFNLYRWPEEGGQDPDYGALVVIDEAGEVVWCYFLDHTIEDALQLRNGNILYSLGRRRAQIREIDMLGNVVDEWHGARAPGRVPPESRLVETDSFHHEIIEKPDGNFAVLSTETRIYDGYPTSDTDVDAPRETSNVVGDKIVEFSRDGTVLRQWSLLDVLDPYRIGFNSIDRGNYWQGIYPELTEEGLNDWAHTNGAFYDERTDAYVLSLRHQDAAVKIDAATGELVWILGTPSHWKAPWNESLLTPVGELEWPYHTHSPEITPQGTLLIFDNGTHRASAYGTKMPLEESYSRVVEYAIDEQNMEVRQVWRYGGPGDERFYSRFISDVDWLSKTGNVLVTDGGRISDAEWRPTGRPGTYRWARIVEVTHTTPPEKVFELHVKGEPPMGWHVYRAEHISSLYGE